MKHFLPFLDPDAEADINELIVHLIGYSDGWNNHPSWEWASLHQVTIIKQLELLSIYVSFFMI